MPHNSVILTAIEQCKIDELERCLGQPEIYGEATALDNDDNTYLHIAVRKYLVEGINVLGYQCLDVLLKNKVDPKLRNKQLQTAFTIDNINCRDGTIVKATPLINAIRNNYDHLFRAVLEHSADVNKTNGDGSSPVCEAATAGRIEMLQALIERGANIYINYAPLSTYNPLLLALFYYHEKDEDIEQTNPINKEKIKQCIELLLSKHAGILLGFNEGNLKDFDLTNIILLGTEPFSDMLNGIATIRKIKTLFKNKEITDAKITEIIYACGKIQEDLTPTLTHLSESRAHQKEAIEEQIRTLKKFIDKLNKILANKILHKENEPEIGRAGIFGASNQNTVAASSGHSLPAAIPSPSSPAAVSEKKRAPDVINRTS